jgi:hypothetical protein
MLDIVKTKEKVMPVKQQLNTSKMSDDDLQDMFSEAYEKNVASYNDIDSFECICKRETGNPKIRMEVLIVGMAGNPTIDDYKKGKVKRSEQVTIEREGKGSLKFVFKPKDTVYLSNNDYTVVYESI